MSTKPFIIVGLGNPGSEYEHTRHNVGAWFVTQLADKFDAHFRTHTKFKGLSASFKLAGDDCQLLIPTTFMNHSGLAVQAIAQFYKTPIERILVIHDELDLPAGTIRLKQNGGHGGHNGLRDIITHLSARDFQRLRIGIGHPGSGHAVVKYVLSKPSSDDISAILSAIKDGISAIPAIIRGEQQQVMKILHTDN